MLLLVLLVAALGVPNSCPGTLAGFSATMLSEVDPACFASMSYTVLATVPDAACSGFSGAQLAALATVQPFDTCEGLSGGCLASILDLTQASVKCLARLNIAACPSLRASQLDSLVHASSLRASCVAVLSSQQCSELGTHFVSQLGSDRRVLQCQSIPCACLASLAHLEAFSSSCWQSLQGAKCAALTSSQTSALPASVAALLSSECVASMSPAVCAVLPWAAVAPAGCSGASASCLNVATLAGITPACVAFFSGPACSGISPVNAKAIPPAAASPDCVAHLSDGACANLVPSFWIGATAAECGAMTPSCVAAADSFGAVGRGCVAAWNSSMFLSFSVAQLSRLSAVGWSAVKGSVFAALAGRYGTAFVTALSPEQLAFPAPNAASDFVALSPRSPDYEAVAGAGATWLQLAWGNTVRFSGTASMPPVAVQGLRPSVPLAGVVLSAAQWENVNCVTLNSLSAQLLSVTRVEHVVWPRMTAGFAAFDLDKEWLPLWRDNVAIVDSYFCPSVLAMSDRWFAALLSVVSVNASAVRYSQWRAGGKCPPEDRARDVPCSGWLRTAKLLLPTSSTVATTSAAPTPPPEWNKFILLGAAGGALIVGALVVVVVVLIRRARRRHSIVYTPLNEMSSAGDMDLATW